MLATPAVSTPGDVHPNDARTTRYPWWSDPFGLVVLAFCSFAFVPLIRPGAVVHGSEEPDQTLAVIWLLLCAVAGLLLARQRRVAPTFRPHGIVIAFVVLAVVSSLWSVDPSITLRRTASLAGTAVAACYLRSHHDLGDLVRLLHRFATAAVVASLAWAFISPSAYEAGGLRGVFFLKNQFGLVAAVGVVTALALALTSSRPRDRFVNLLAGVASMTALLASSSVTPLLAALAGVGFCLAVYLVARGTPEAALGIAFVLAAVATAALAMGVTSVVLGSVQEYAHLTERVDLWRSLDEPVGERFVEGWGYGAYWSSAGPSPQRVVRSAAWPGSPPGSAHSGFLEGLLGLGLAGVTCLALLLGALVSVAVRACSQQRWLEGVSVLGMVGLIATYNFGESDLLRSRSLLSLVLVAMTAVPLGARAGGGPRDRRVLDRRHLP